MLCAFGWLQKATLIGVGPVKRLASCTPANSRLLLGVLAAPLNKSQSATTSLVGINLTCLPSASAFVETLGGVASYLLFHLSEMQNPGRPQWDNERNFLGFFGGKGELKFEEEQELVDYSKKQGEARAASGQDSNVFS